MADVVPNPVVVGPIKLGQGQPLALIAGPCVMEPGDMTMRIALRLVEICDKLAIPLVFKASYDKANRTSVSSYRGPGLEAGMKIFGRVKAETGLPVTTDVHETHQAALLADMVDLLQVPAFLARQTDLLEAAAQTGRPINVKKGQFMAPWDMGNAVTKLLAFGASGAILTERGSSFGYGRLVNDFRAIPQMQETGCACGFRRHSLGAVSRRGCRRHHDLGPARNDSHARPRSSRRRLRCPFPGSAPRSG